MTSKSGWIVNHVMSGAAAKVEQHSQSTGKGATSMFAFPKSKDPAGKGGYVYVEIKKRSAIFSYYRSDGVFLYKFSSKGRN